MSWRDITDEEYAAFQGDPGTQNRLTAVALSMAKGSTVGDPPVEFLYQGAHFRADVIQPPGSSATIVHLQVFDLTREWVAVDGVPFMRLLVGPDGAPVPS